MRKSVGLAALAFALLIQSCSAPNRSRQASSGKIVLGKAVEEIETYKDRNGRYPLALDDIRKGYREDLEKELRVKCPECTDFNYRTDAFGFEMEYQFRKLGKNRCRYSTDTLDWDCQGIY